MRSLELSQAKRQREEREAHSAATLAAADAQLEAERDALRQAELEKAIEAESNQPPLTPDKWNASCITGLAPSIEYLFERIREGGDRFNTMKFYRGAMIFNPSYAKTLNHDQAMVYINKMSTYPAFAEGGNDSLIEQLKRRWPAYKVEANHVLTGFGDDFNEKRDRNGITTWHYRWHLRLEANDERSVWYKACKLAALVVPSSGTS